MPKPKQQLAAAISELAKAITRLAATQERWVPQRFYGPGGTGSGGGSGGGGGASGSAGFSATVRNIGPTGGAGGVAAQIPVERAG